MSQNAHGHRVWYFPDGDLPPKGDQEPHGHESLLILNPQSQDAQVVLTVYFEDRPSRQIEPESVSAERVRCFRLDQPLGAFSIPRGQYALRVESTVPVICQIGRMDVRQANLAYYTVMGLPAD